jgi:hypothetical protein
VKVRLVIERILAILLFVSLIASFFIIPYLITHTVLGTFLFIIGFILTTSLGYLISVTSIKTARSLGERIKQASSEELKREDDVLLQAVALSQSVFFIYLNQIESSIFVIAFKITVPIFAVSFYILRGWAKIRNSPRHRYWSIWVLIFIALNTILWSIFALIVLIMRSENMEIWNYFITSIYSSVIFGSMQFVKEIFKKRYGY